MIRPLSEALRDALDRGHFDGIPYEPTNVLPLDVALGPDWLVLSRWERGTVVALHRSSGVWADVAFEVAIHPGDAEVCATALKAGAGCMVGGQYTVEATRLPGGSVEARVMRVADPHTPRTA